MRDITIAARRWEGVTDMEGSGRVVARRSIVAGLLLVEGEWVKRDVGCAIRMTPKKEIRPEIFSTLVKGSFRSFEQA